MIYTQNVDFCILDKNIYTYQESLAIPIYKNRPMVHHTVVNIQFRVRNEATAKIQETYILPVFQQHLVVT